MFRFHQKVLFKHCDPAGIVFYPRYFEMINDCIETFFDHLGHPFEDLLQKNGVPTAQIAVQFVQPSRHGDQLTLGLDVAKVGGSSLDLSIEALADEATRFRATSTLVHVDLKGKPERWPDALRASLSSYHRRPI